MRKLQKRDVTVHSVVVVVVEENFFNPQMSSAESECQIKRNASPPESGVKLVASRLVESCIIGFDSMFIDDNRHIICKKKLVKCERIPIPSHAKKTVSRS